MKTMEKLIARFNKMNPDYLAELSHDSWEEKYTIYITEPVCGLVERHVFASCREFREWMDGVVLY